MAAPAKRRLRVGIVGATGMVGQELLHVIEESDLPIAELKPFSSGSVSKTVLFRSKRLPAPKPDPKSLQACDMVFFVSADKVSRKLAPGLAANGVWVIDDSSAFRQCPSVPLVIPEVNAKALRRDSRLIAGPNCTMTPIAVAGAALHRKFGVTQVRLATYQAVSGAGRSALEEFFSQLTAAGRLAVDGRAPVPKAPPHSALPRPIAFNVFPQVGEFDAAGDSSEERKVGAELRKVWDAPALRVSVTAVRVPVVRGHSLAAWLTLRRPVPPGVAERILALTPGLELMKRGDYPTPLQAGGKGPVFAGRVRRGTNPRELCLWLCCDNLIKGAALNSVQIALELARRGWL